MIDMGNEIGLRTVDADGNVDEMALASVMAAIKALGATRVAMLADGCRSAEWPARAREAQAVAETYGDADEALEWKALGAYYRRDVARLAVLAALKSIPKSGGLSVQIIGGADDCDCDNCRARREQEKKDNGNTDDSDKEVGS